MSQWKELTKEEEEENYQEITIKIPKHTLALIINFLERRSGGILNMGNIQFDEEDIQNLLEVNKDE